MKVDWSGGCCHARAIKDVQLPPLRSITPSQTVHVSLRRIFKDPVAKFTVVHGSEPIVGTAWCFGSVKCGVVSLNKYKLIL